MPYSSVDEVFDYLYGDKNGAPYHLKLLSLDFREEPTWNKSNDLALKLKHSPEIIAELIRDENWRPTLIGIAVVILLRAKEFQKDLIWRLENFSWVAPQIAVALALLNDGFAEKELQRIIENASEESNPKTILSAYCGLNFLESKFANEFQQTKLFEILRKKDWDGTIGIAKNHWNYWKTIEPVN